MGISAHIARLRAAVGHDLLLLPSVTAMYEAAIIDGSPAVRDGELSDMAWFTPAQLADLELSRFARALLSATGYL
jgi:hypothetical protein